MKDPDFDPPRQPPIGMGSVAIICGTVLALAVLGILVALVLHGHGGFVATILIAFLFFLVLLANS